MMGQQQTVAGSALRRIILALAIAAIMATMAVAMAAPAFAAGGTPGQGVPKGGQTNQNPGATENDYTGGGWNGNGFRNGSDAFNNHGNGDGRN